METALNLIVKSTHHNKPIITDVFFQKNNTKKPIVIFCHGYKGYKDWGAWNLVAEKFAMQNFFFVKFNFSHNGGTAKTPIDFPDLDTFGENNFCLELNDLEDIINWTRTTTTFKNEINISNITLIGHSRGGGIVTIKASENKNITHVISWNGVSDYAARFPKGKNLETWKKNKISYVLNARTNQKMPHLYQFYQNFKENEARLTIKTAVTKLKIPHLIVCGEKDIVVPISEAENLHRWNPKSELFNVKEMNHTLGCTQPWESTKMPVYLEQVVKKSIDFLV